MYRLYDNSANCPAVGSLNLSREFSSSFFASFTSDGQKTICLAIADDAGNTSPVRKASITVDTIAPTAPTLDPKNLSGVNSSCVNITPSGNVDTNFWKFQYRQAGEGWEDSLTDSGEAITIPLYLDSDNIIEVRAVDRAGNAGEVAQALVEETSSVFIPTSLQIKQICDGGRYAILKDLSIPLTQIQNSFDTEPDNVKIVKIPAVALLDLQTYEIRQLNPAISSEAITDADCNAEALLQMVLDAACSVEDGESRMLVVSPAEPLLQGCIIPAPPRVGAYARNRLWVYRPIDQPLQLGAELDSNVTIDYTDSLSTAMAIISIDALRWPNQNDNDF